MIDSVRPVLMFDSGYITMLIAMVGTSIAPVDAVLSAGRRGGKGHYREGVRESRVEVILGCILTDRGRVLHHRRVRGRDLVTRPARHQGRSGRGAGLEALRAIRVPAVQRGSLQRVVFRRLHSAAVDLVFGLRGPGLRIGRQQALPRSTGVLLAVHTFLIVVGAAVILIPGFDLVKMILFSQVINGVLLPFILIFMTLLINKKGLMKEWTNSRFYNVVSWVSVALMIGLTLALVAISIQDMRRGA